MRFVEPRDEGPTFVRRRAAILLVTVIALAGTGIGCTRARPAQSATPASAPASSSKETTQAIKAQIRSRVAQRAAVMSELGALGDRVAPESGSSSPSTDNATTQVARVQRTALAEELDILDVELAAQTERYNALQPWAPMATP